MEIYSKCMKIVDEDPYVTPMMITLQYTTWEELGLIITYKLQFLDVSLWRIISLITGNRLGASALMQGLADGYFVLPYTMVII
jgi:succinate dehydrogenase / fumarate reductase flavoprotein subunit